MKSKPSFIILCHLFWRGGTPSVDAGVLFSMARIAPVLWERVCRRGHKFTEESLFLDVGAIEEPILKGTRTATTKGIILGEYHELNFAQQRTPTTYHSIYN